MSCSGILENKALLRWDNEFTKTPSARYIAWKVLTELEQGSFRHHADE